MTLEEYFSAKACVEKQEDKPKKKSKTEEIKQHAAIDPVNSIPNEHGVKEEVIVADINGNNFSTRGLNMKNYNEIDVLIKKRMETFSNKLKNTQGTRKTADINRKYKEKVKEGYENNRIDRMIKEWKTLNSKQAKNFSIYDGIDHVRSIYSSLINGGALNFDAKSLAKKIGKGALIAGGVTAGLGAGLGTAGLIAASKLNDQVGHDLNIVTGKLTGQHKLNGILKEIDSLDYSSRTKVLAKDTVRDMYDYLKNHDPSQLNKYLDKVDNNLDSLVGHEKTTFWGKEVDNIGALDAALAN